MSSLCIRSLLLACTGFGALCVASVDANAGGFALREQSAYGQGSSFAGIAAGGALSSMFWNPATITQFAGKTLEADVSAIFPHASQSYSSSFLTATFGGALPAYRNGVDNSGNSAFLPTMYASWQLNPQLWAGLSVNAPFGLGVSFPRQWAGASYGQDADVKSYNVAPTLAYKISDMISVAVGLQVQYMTIGYTGALPPSSAAFIGGKGYSYGFTAGATITPTPTTTIGIGYRSALNQKINGDLSATANISGTTYGSVNVDLNLPALLSVGLRQGIGDRWTLLAGFEWQNWSRIGTANLLTPSGAPATIGSNPITFPFQYSDGYFYSLGAEYIWDPSLTLRAGIAFEKSPITDAVRTPRLPDNDRMWYSVGASYKHPQFRGLTFDLGYSFIDVKDTPINVVAGNPWLPAGSANTYVGSVDSHIHIFSVALRYQWDNAAPLKTKLITK